MLVAGSTRTQAVTAAVLLLCVGSILLVWSRTRAADTGTYYQPQTQAHAGLSSTPVSLQKEPFGLTTVQRKIVCHSHCQAEYAAMLADEPTQSKFQQLQQDLQKVRQQVFNSLPPPPPDDLPASSGGDALFPHFTPARFQHVLRQVQWLHKFVPPSAEGGSFVFAVSTQTLFRAATTLPNFQVYCESGFNGGHSAMTILAANPTAKVYSIDLMGRPYSGYMAELVSRAYGDRFHLIRGDVFDVLRNASAFGGDKCDFIFADSHAKSSTENLAHEELALWPAKAARKAVLMYEASTQYAAAHPHVFDGPGSEFAALVQERSLRPLRVIHSDRPASFGFQRPNGPPSMTIWLYSVGPMEYTEAELAIMAM